ncbi:hypothetical protein [Hafnia phage yong3]|nr:hypothetical protein [Hafnia phage yong3]
MTTLAALRIVHKALYPSVSLAVVDDQMMLQRVMRRKDYHELLAYAKMISYNKLDGRTLPLDELAAQLRIVIADRDAIRNPQPRGKWWQ